MTISAVNQTPSRGLAVPEVIQNLNFLCYFARACSHLLAGWIPRFPDMDVKVNLGLHTYDDIRTASGLRGRLRIMTQLETTPQVDKRWVDLMAQADAVDKPEELFDFLYRHLKPMLKAATETFVQETDAVADHPSFVAASELCRTLEAQLDWTRLCNYGLGRAPKALADACGDVAAQRHVETGLDWSESFLEVGARAPRVARPDTMKPGFDGSFRSVVTDPIDDIEDIGKFLIAHLNDEWATMELIARNSYEHTDMPWECHVDMLRQVADEARHALVVLRLATDLGMDYSEWPPLVLSYEAEYEFAPCDVGSRRELLWRILIRQTFQEGMAIDSHSFEIERRNFAGQPEVARVFEMILIDETMHVRSGLKWSRYLVDGDEAKVQQEREEAHKYYVSELNQRRDTFVSTHPKQAMAELRALEEADRKREQLEPLPFELTHNMQYRRKLGYTDADLSQVANWGYLPVEQGDGNEAQGQATGNAQLRDV